jgi:hypothetical protein
MAADDADPISLLDALPTVDENLLQCLVPWPTGEESLGMFYDDLFDAASPNPLVPSPISSDPTLKLISDVRAALAHAAVLQFSGALAADPQNPQNPVSPYAGTVIEQSSTRFVQLYATYCAALVQTCWRASRRGASSDTRKKFRIAIGWHPKNAGNPEERRIRKGLIDELLTEYPPILE